MTESEKKTQPGGKKKRSRTTVKREPVKEKEPEPSPPDLNRDQLESLREKLQRKYH